MRHEFVVFSQHDSIGNTACNKEVFKRGGDLYLTSMSTDLASATVSMRFLRIRSNPTLAVSIRDFFCSFPYMTLF